MSEFLDRISRLSPKRLALLALELKEKVDALERAAREPIAVVGLGCRFPGGAQDPDSFWQLLHEGRDAVSEIPRERWDVDEYYDPDPDAPGKMSTRHGAFLARVDGFDPQFFGISPREALSMDPQQRLLLEVAWEALEHAGQAPARLHGSRTGVFVGICSSDYINEVVRAGGASAFDAHLSTGGAHSVASGRISYLLGLRGPSVSIDTACSSSLVAVQLACQSLRAGDCRLALAGGVNLILSPDITLTLSKSRMMAADGRCKTFDAAADGFVRGEGCGVVVLKRLSDAQAEGDRVLAVIRGVAVNQDGRSSGLTAPNGPAQEDVIRAALANGGIDPREVGYVEAHGTGTSLGDPIEVRALAAVLGAGRTAETRLRIGSVKTNFGHLEAAAGVAGLIKLVLALQHRELPPQLHFRTPNPHIAWDEVPIDVVTRQTPWTPRGGRRIGAVSSFGFSGTNAHLVLEEAPPCPAPAPGVERAVHLLTLSARTDAALRELARRYGARLVGETALGLADACFTAGVGRSHLAERAALQVASPQEAAAKLATLAAGEMPGGAWRGVVPAAGAPDVAFLFSGQGAQYVGMGRRLFETQPTFRKALERCDEILRPLLPRPLLSVIYPESGAASPLDETAYTQPALFALEWALSELWKSWGIEPAFVMGHSVGEYVAACVVGVFSLEDGLRLIAERGRLMQSLPAGGAMAAVMAGETRVCAALAAHPGRVGIAAQNGPENVVISGDAAAVERVTSALAQEGIKSRRLTLSHAFHSPLMEPILAEFTRVAQGLQPAPPRVGLVSNLTGGWASPELLQDPGYWSRHLREPVRFAAGMQTLWAKGCRVFVEVGPGPTLLGMGRRCVPEDVGAWLPSLRPGRDDWESLLDSLGRLYVGGAEVDWVGFDRDYARQRVSLPTYPWERQRYWVEGVGRGLQASAPRPGRSPYEDWLYEVAWRPQAARDAAATARPLAQVAQAAAAHFEPLASRHGFGLYTELLPELDALCSAYVAQAFRGLGWDPRPGERVSGAGLRQQLGIVVAHARLTARLLEILGEDGILDRAGSEWEVRQSPAPVDPTERLAALRRRFPEAEAELTLTGRCGQRLADVLRGACDPLQLLFPGGSVAEAEKLYQDAPVARVYNGLVAEAVAAVIEGLPAGRPLRVLELGAGTGGTTSLVLPRLDPHRTEYFFTDVSRLFTAKAEKKFSSHAFVRYDVLDLEQDPETQGFAPHAFDLVLAANVVHATRDLRRSLRHARRLLAPGGVLVLLEATSATRFGDITVGLTDGWWRFADLELRRGYALLPREEWLGLLGGEGFEEAVSFPAAAREDAASRQAVFLARAPRAERRPGRWLILADRGGTGRALAAALELRGESSVVAFARAGASEHGGALELDPARPEAFADLLRVRGDVPWHGVVHLWSLDAPFSEHLTSEALLEAQELCCASVLHLVQALAREAGGAPPRLWLVTRGAQDAGAAGPVAAVQAPLWGLARVISLEHPEWRCARVDLDPSARADDVEALARELMDEVAEDQVAYRDGSRRVARLARTRVPAAAAGFSADATYLITGGLRGLGLRVAEWMVERGARNLILMGRSGVSAQARDVIVRLEARGAKVRAAQGDVSREDALRAALDGVGEALPALRGVIHSAGVLDDGVLVQQDWGRFRKVMAPKIEGGWLLHRLTRDQPLDFFVLFSSGASLLGSAGQGNHAAANAFLDALAHARRSWGLPALSINWGAWADVGAAADRAVSHAGSASIPPSAGLDALGALLGGPAIQVGVVPVDWAALGERRVVSPFLAELIAAAGPARSAPITQPAQNMRERLASAPLARRRALLESCVRDEAARVLGLPASPALDPERPLQEYGLDSLLAVELRNALVKAVGTSLPATLLFDHPSIDALVRHLGHDVLALELDPLPEPTPGSEAVPAKALEHMSADEMAALLSSKLDSLEPGRSR